MIVTCERCATQFQLDDSRVPDSGVRVRCSRCKHSFLIEPPGKAAAREEPSGLMEKRDAEAARGPQGPPPGLRLGGAAPEAAASDTDEEESDWQFNEELPSDADSSLDGRVAAADVVDQLLGASAAPPAAGSGAGSDEESPFETAGESGLDLARGASDAGAAEPAADAAPGPSSSLGTVDPAPAAPPEDPAAGDALESPEDWDLFGDVEGDAPAAAPEAAPRQPLRVAADAEPAPDDFDTGPSRLGVALAHAGNAAGWLAVVCLIGFGLLGAFRPQSSAADAPDAVDVAGLELSATHGRWIENAVAGPVYVVSGRLRNGGSRPVPAPPLAVEILDAEGRVLAGPEPVWSLRSERELREAPPETLSRGRPLGDGSGRLPPGLGSFDAVLPSLPSGAADFRVVRAPAGLAAGRAATPSRAAGPPSTGPVGAPTTAAATAPADAPAEEVEGAERSEPASGSAAPPAAPAP